MNNNMNSGQVIHHKNNKMASVGHSGSHEVNFAGKMQPRRKHLVINSSGIKPNGDPDEVMLWGDA